VPTRHPTHNTPVAPGPAYARKRWRVAVPDAPRAPEPQPQDESRQTCSSARLSSLSWPPRRLLTLAAPTARCFWTLRDGVGSNRCRFGNSRLIHLSILLEECIKDSPALQAANRTRTLPRSIRTQTLRVKAPDSALAYGQPSRTRRLFVRRRPGTSAEEARRHRHPLPAALQKARRCGRAADGPPSQTRVLRRLRHLQLHHARDRGL